MTEFTQISNLNGFANLAGRDINGLSQGEQTLSPFLQIIENMVAGMEEDEKNSILNSSLLGENLLLALEEGILKKTETEDDEEIINTLTENMGFMFNPIPVNVKQVSPEELKLISQLGISTSDFQEESKIDVSILSSVNEKTVEENVNIAPTIKEEKLMFADIDKLARQENLIIPNETSTKTTNKKIVERPQNVDESSTDGGFEQKDTVFVTQKTYTSALSNEALKTQQEFATAVGKVKSQLKGEAETDIKTDTRQAENTTLNSEPTFEKIELASGKVVALKMESQMENPKLANQIKTEINAHLPKGDKEFTMKLKPEELGEITIKMVKSGEKVIVDIVAANPKTVQLLNSDLGALRDILKPMQAEVRPVVSAEASDGFKQMQDFNMSGQSFTNQQNQWKQRENQPSYYGDISYLDEEITSKSTVTANSPKLKVYI